MKTIIQKFKQILTGTCVINTVIITLLYILGYITNTDGGTAWIPKFNIMWTVLGVSFVLSLSERVFDLRGSFAFKLCLNFAMCVTGFLLVFIVGGGYGDNPSSVIVGTFIFILAYLLVNGIRFAVTGKFKRRENEEEEYSSVFKK